MLPSFERLWALVAVIQPNPGAEEPKARMSHSNMAMGWLLVSELPPTAHCKTTVIFERSTPFHWPENFALRMQAPGDIPSLNEAGKMPLVCLRDRQVRSEQLSDWDQVPIHDSQQGVLTHMLIIWGWQVGSTKLHTRMIGGAALCLVVGCWVLVTG